MGLHNGRKTARFGMKMVCAAQYSKLLNHQMEREGEKYGVNYPFFEKYG
jgi:hypothetical protein